MYTIFTPPRIQVTSQLIIELPISVHRVQTRFIIFISSLHLHYGKTHQKRATRTPKNQRISRE
jgi:hypothetical protein